jgi:hypothetical protein
LLAVHGRIHDRAPAKLVLQAVRLAQIDPGPVPVLEEIVHHDPRHARDVDHVRPHGREALAEAVLQPVGRRHRDHDGHDADDDAQGREDAARLVGAEGAEGDLERFAQARLRLHPVVFPPACGGPSAFFLLLIVTSAPLSRSLEMAR